MGLFDSPDALLNVQFYGSPSATAAADPVSVEYPLGGRSAEAIARDFTLYTQKVLFNLGRGLPATLLGMTMGVYFTCGLTKSSDVLSGDNYQLRLVQPGSGGAKRCQAKFYKDRGPWTKFSLGGEDYYAPMSCFAFLQHVINGLPSDQLEQFSRIAGRAFKPGLGM